MFTRFFIMFSLCISFANAQYYTSTDSRMNSKKTIYFDQDAQIIVDKNSIQLKSSEDLKWLGENKEPIKFKRQSIHPSIKGFYETVNFAYLLQNTIGEKTFLLKTPSLLLEIKRLKMDKRMHSILHFKQVKAIEYSYEVVNAYKEDGNTTEIPQNKILSKYLYQKNIIAIKLNDQAIQKVKKITSPKLDAFLHEEKTRITQVKSFDFSKQKLYFDYVSKNSSSRQALQINYQMKKKNIKIVLKTPASLLDPAGKSNTIIEHVGILRDTHKELFELKKVELVKGKQEVTWVNLPKKAIVPVTFLNNNEKETNRLSKAAGQQFYSIEGLFYLVSWMHKKDESSKIITYMNAQLPFDATVEKTGANEYALKKRSQVIYKFTLDNRHMVTSMQYPQYKVNLQLAKVESDLTIKNKKFLKDFMYKNHISLIKE